MFKSCVKEEAVWDTVRRSLISRHGNDVYNVLALFVFRLTKNIKGVSTGPLRIGIIEMNINVDRIRMQLCSHFAGDAMKGGKQQHHHQFANSNVVCKLKTPQFVCIDLNIKCVHIVSL